MLEETPEVGDRMNQLVFVKRCRFLEQSGCASVCVNACRVPTQDLFNGDMEVPMRIEQFETRLSQVRPRSHLNSDRMRRAGDAVAHTRVPVRARCARSTSSPDVRRTPAVNGAGGLADRQRRGVYDGRHNGASRAERAARG